MLIILWKLGQTRMEELDNYSSPTYRISSKLTAQQI